MKKNIFALIVVLLLPLFISCGKKGDSYSESNSTQSMSDEESLSFDDLLPRVSLEHEKLFLVQLIFYKEILPNKEEYPNFHKSDKLEQYWENGIVDFIPFAFHFTKEFTINDSLVSFDYRFFKGWSDENYDTRVEVTYNGRTYKSDYISLEIEFLKPLENNTPFAYRSTSNRKLRASCLIDNSISYLDDETNKNIDDAIYELLDREVISLINAVTSRYTKDELLNMYDELLYNLEKHIPPEIESESAKGSE